MTPDKPNLSPRDPAPPEPSLSGLRIGLLGEFSERGGANTYFHFLLEFLIREGAELTVIVTSPMNSKSVAELSARGITWEVWEQPWARIGQLSRFDVLSRNPLAYVIEASALHNRFMTGGPRPSLIVQSICSPGRFLPLGKSNVPVVQIHHSYPRGPLHLLAGKWFGFLAKRSATLIGVSEFLTKTLTSVWKLPPGHAARTLWNTAGPLATSTTPLENGRKIILTVGELNDAKAPFRFIRVAAEVLNSIPDSKFLFRWVGAGPLLEECIKLVNSLGLNDYVEFSGYSSSPQEHYVHAWLYMQLSKVDSMPLATLDAMRHGLPAIVSNAGGLPSLVAGINPDLIVDGDNPAQAAVMIGRLFQNDEFVSELRHATLREYKTRFSEVVWKTQMKAVLFSTMSKGFPQSG